MISVVIVDDQEAVRRGLRMRLSAEDDFSVIGEAADGREGVELASSLSPDVVVMDVAMPTLDGISAASALRLCCPLTEIVMLSVHDDEATQARARAAGVAAFITKSMQTEALLSAIREVAR